MGTLGNIVSDAVDAASGKSSGTNLEKFLQKFGSAHGRYVDTLDPESTFDVKFKFFPTITAEESKKKQKSSMLERIGQSAVNSVKSAATNLLDNITGGLFSSLTEGESIKKQHKNFGEIGKHTFMEYLAKANLLQGGEQWQSPEQAACPLELQMGFYIEQINMPNLKIQDGGKSSSMFGEFQVPGMAVESEGSFTMDVLNTKAALHERIFYPWLRETTLPFWSYESQPYTTANIIVDFNKHNDVKYVFTGCRPTMINLLTASQAADGSNIRRQVTFAYDFLFITSKLKVNESASDRIKGTIGSFASGAAKMMNM